MNTVTCESMLVDVKELPTSIEIEGVGGVRKLSRVGQWSIFGLAVVNTGIPLNIVSLNCTEKLHDVHYSQSDSFTLQSEVVLEIAARKKMCAESVDVPCAYLNGNSNKRHMIVGMIIELDAKLEEYRNINGSIVVEL